MILILLPGSLMVLCFYSMNNKTKNKEGWWITSPKDLHEIVQALDDSKHFSLFPKENLKYIRHADAMERKAGEILEWNKTDPRTF